MRVPLMGRAGMKIKSSDGWEELGLPDMMSTPLFYFANPGDRIAILDKEYKFNVATYSPEVEPRWIYTYDYSPNESWTVYRHDLSGESYRQEDYVFSENVYFRVCLRKINGGDFDGTEDINDIISFEASPAAEAEAKLWLESEVLRAARRAEAVKKPGTLVFALLTDTHYVVNGTWDDTALSVRRTHELLGFDGIIHLGDFTDGMVTAEAARHYANKVLDDLKGCGIPVYVTLGNHDSNYFRNNMERFTLKEQCELYLGRTEPRYSADYAESNLRLIFLDSFDPAERTRYGYSQECVRWLEETLDGTPDGWQIVIFSHMPPIAGLQYWAKEIRGGDEIIESLRTHSGKILAWVNGHNHADMVYNGPEFSSVSIANAKCEAFTDYKTPGFITPERRLGDASQELWDILLINAGEKKLDFVRFGAGHDRSVTK